MPSSDHIKSYHHRVSQEVQIGDLVIGGRNPIRIQSMTNTNTLDTEATVDQMIRLVKAGCDIIRITAPGVKEAENFANIKSALTKIGITIPIVADIHFNPKAAEIAAKYVEKVRINPGNYVDWKSGKIDWDEAKVKLARERIADKLLPLLKICQSNGTAIRIGTNHGSLSERILSTYGNTPLGMVESAMEFVQICRNFNFHNLILSMKASNVQIMVEANRLLVERMIEADSYYPLHLGVTEAGAGEEARIKSAAGIGSLLASGIGDTIRVSLTEDPVNEIPVAKKLVDLYGRNETAFKKTFSGLQLLKPQTDKSLQEITGQRNPVIVSGYTKISDCYLAKNLLKPAQGNNKPFEFETIDINKSKIDQPVIFKKVYQNLPFNDLLIIASVDFALIFSKQKKGGIWIENDENYNKIAGLSLKILQALGIRYSKAEFIACPSCGRTKFDIMSVFDKVRKKTSHLKGLKIAVMGCVVNGPGEMAGADYGYVGAGRGKVTLYKSGEAVLKNIDEDLAVDALVELMKKGGDWQDETL